MHYVNEGTGQLTFDLTDAANAEGAKLVPMTINRPGGLMLSWETFHPFSDRPSFLEVADLPLAERVEKLRDPARRARILAEPVQTPMFEHAATIILSSLGSTYLPTTESLNEPDPAASLGRAIEAAGLTERVIVSSFYPGCLRKVRLKREHDYYLDPEELYWAFRGQLMHDVAKRWVRRGDGDAIAERRFAAKVFLDAEPISGQPDLIYRDRRHVLDFKTCRRPSPTAG